MRTIEEVIEWIKENKWAETDLYEEVVHVKELLEFINTPEPCRHVNPISGNRWDKVFVPDCKINFCPNCGVKLEEA